LGRNFLKKSKFRRIREARALLTEMQDLAEVFPPTRRQVRLLLRLTRFSANLLSIKAQERENWIWMAV